MLINPLHPSNVPPFRIPPSHNFLLLPAAVNTDKAQMGAHMYTNTSHPTLHPVEDVLVLNHYVVRSLEEFKYKMSRGSAMKLGNG